MATMIRLLLVEHRASVSKGLRMLLGAESDISLIGEAPDADAALRMAAALHPDIVLLDVDMPHVDGVAATRALRLMCPNIGIIVLSLHDEARTRLSCTEAGADAFVGKSMPAAALLASIREVAGL